MRTVDFTIPYPDTKAGKSRWMRLYGLNAYYAGKHWAERRQDAVLWHSMTRNALSAALPLTEPLFEAAEIEFSWDDGLDIDNHAAMGKMITDALKKRIIVDDDRRHLLRVSHEFWDGGCIRVTIREVGNGA